jgi:hypothetical protein
MPADITYEGGGSSIVIVAKADIANGWRRLKNTFGSWSAAHAPFHGNIDLRAKVEVVARPNYLGQSFHDFPLNLKGEFGSDALRCRYGAGSLEVRFLRSDLLPWRFTPARYPELFWEEYPMAAIGRRSLSFRFWAVFVLPDKLRTGDIREWNTQFCSGGLPSLGKR